VRFAGDARDAWLEANGRRWRAGSVPAGTYVVWATFGDDAATPKAAALTLTAGTSVTVSCRSTFDRCAVE
jgi:hypothetical protein